jgi:hypothetical protein
MNELRFTLVGDGGSDKALIPVITWLLRGQKVTCAIQPEWADLWSLPRRPRGLTERIRLGLELYPCDLLCVHRDAETQSRETRVAEILKAVQSARLTESTPAVCIVPVRMTEAWLLLDEAALRRASDNPSGRQPLDLPRISQIETLPDPKRRLHELLREASGLHGRRRSKLSVANRTARVADLVDDFSPLRGLSAFRALEEEIRQIVQAHGWSSPPTVTPGIDAGRVS